jgi:hypothetical protein
MVVRLSAPTTTPPSNWTAMIEVYDTLRTDPGGYSLRSRTPRLTSPFLSCSTSTCSMACGVVGGVVAGGQGGRRASEARTRRAPPPRRARCSHRPRPFPTPSSVTMAQPQLGPLFAELKKAFRGDDLKQSGALLARLKVAPAPARRMPRAHCLRVDRARAERPSPAITPGENQ